MLVICDLGFHSHDLRFHSNLELDAWNLVLVSNLMLRIWCLMIPVHWHRSVRPSPASSPAVSLSARLQSILAGTRVQPAGPEERCHSSRTPSTEPPRYAR